MMQTTHTLAALLLLALSVQEEPSRDGPKLVIDGPRVQALNVGAAMKGMGKRFQFTARLEGELEDPEEFYCLDEIWEWGDGTESVHETDCDPYEEGAEVKREFRGSHGYTYGRYAVSLRLVRRGETVIRSTFDIEVH